MTLTPKETSLLNDLRTQEEVCIEKYRSYSDSACDGELKNLFSSILVAECSHLDTITRILSGEEVAMPSPPSAVSEATKPTPSSCPADKKAKDKFLCQDALAMEKHVSSVYDISIFEFSNPVLRDTLSHIQKEEQNHGERLYLYMSANGMY